MAALYQTGGGYNYITDDPVIRSLGDGANGYTIAMWLNIASGLSNGRIYDKRRLRMRPDSNDGTNYGLFVAQDRVTTSAAITTDNLVCTIGQWHFILVTFESTAGLKLYVDNVQITAVTGEAVGAGAMRTESGDNFGLLNRYSDDLSLSEGRLNQFGIWSNELSASDRNTVFSSKCDGNWSGVDSSNIVVYAPLNEGSGTSSDDLSSNDLSIVVTDSWVNGCKSGEKSFYNKYNSGSYIQY